MSAVEFRRTPAGAAPLIGVGAIAAEAGGLRIRGRAPATTWPVLAGALVGIFGVIAAAIALVALDIDVGSGRKLPLLVGLACGIAPGVLVHDALRRRAVGRAIDALVEWPGVRVISRGPGAVTLHLASFDVRGEIELLALDDDARALFDATWPPRA